jgi:FtsH-binding integral membrane protein
MNHLAVTSILTVVAHIIWFASMTERKYPIKKTVLLYGLYAIFFTLWAILAYSLLGKDSPYVIPFSFVGTILPAILLFLYTSSDSFSKIISEFIHCKTDIYTKLGTNTVECSCSPAVSVVCASLYAYSTRRQKTDLVLYFPRVLSVFNRVCNAYQLPHA